MAEQQLNQFAKESKTMEGVSACASSPRQKASALGQEQGFSERLFSTKLFTLCGLLRPGLSSHSKILRVYIEGDGHAWESRTRPSTNPTPRNPVALRLAMADPGADTVLYLARPCQYVQGEDRRQCSNRYWTSFNRIILALPCVVNCNNLM